MDGQIEKAFADIYEKHAKKIFWYILQLCKDPVLAEDILQTTFLKAIENADRFRGNCHVDTWLCKIAKNTWLDECKRSEGKNISMDAFIEENGDAILHTCMQHEILQQIIEKEEKESLYQAIDNLDEPYGGIVKLRSFVGLSFKEIAKLYGKTETWARVSYYRAKEAMIKEMERM